MEYSAVNCMVTLRVIKEQQIAHTEEESVMVPNLVVVDYEVCVLCAFVCVCMRVGACA